MKNLAILIGNLGKDPEFKQLESNSVCKFTIATSEQWKNKQGEKVEETQWHNIEVWGKLADICGKYLKKGSKVYVEGKIKTEEYEKDGIKRYSNKIVAKEVKFLDSKGSESNSIPEKKVSDDLPF